MSEYEPTVTPEVRLTPERTSPDWRRLEVASHRFEHRIANGIAAALAEHREVDHDTARYIAHALGRAFGRESALAEFGRTGESTYLDPLRLVGAGPVRLLPLWRDDPVSPAPRAVAAPWVPPLQRLAAWLRLWGGPAGRPAAAGPW